jgi:repressor LexA
MTATGSFPIPRGLLADGDGNLLLLRIPDDSMAAAGLAAGEWAIVREQADAEDGEIVAVMIDGDATARTFRHLGEAMWLEPRDDNWPMTRGSNTTVIGLVTAVIHRIPKRGTP